MKNNQNSLSKSQPQIKPFKSSISSDKSQYNILKVQTCQSADEQPNESSQEDTKTIEWRQKIIENRDTTYDCLKKYFEKLDKIVVRSVETQKRFVDEKLQVEKHMNNDLDTDEDSDSDLDLQAYYNDKLQNIDNQINKFNDKIEHKIKVMEQQMISIQDLISGQKKDQSIDLKFDMATKKADQWKKDKPQTIEQQIKALSQEMNQKIDSAQSNIETVLNSVAEAVQNYCENSNVNNQSNDKKLSQINQTLIQMQNKNQLELKNNCHIFEQKIAKLHQKATEKHNFSVEIAKSQIDLTTKNSMNNDNKLREMNQNVLLLINLIQKDYVRKQDLISPTSQMELQKHKVKLNSNYTNQDKIFQKLVEMQVETGSVLRNITQNFQLQAQHIDQVKNHITILKNSVRLSENAIGTNYIDSCNVPFQFPSESQMNIYRTSDPQGLADLQILQIHAYYTYQYWKFDISNSDESSNFPMSQSFIQSLDKTITLTQSSKKVKQVDIHQDGSFLLGLVFWDGEGNQIASIKNGKVPCTQSVVLADDEKICGVKGKTLIEGSPFIVEFQLIISKTA